MGVRVDPPGSVKNPEDAVKEFYKRHDSFEDKIHSVYERTSMYTYQKVM